MTNPGQTSETSSFSFKITDPDDFTIEEASSGITFTPTAGSFDSLSISLDKTTINEMGVYYTFTMRPSDVFTSNAQIKITLPAQLSVENECRISAADDLIDTRASNVDVSFNRIIYIRDAFPDGMPVKKTFSFTLSDFKNAPTIQTTEAFDVIIFYTEFTDEVSHSTASDTNLMVTSTPSTTALTMSA